MRLFPEIVAIAGKKRERYLTGAPVSNCRDSR